MNTALQTRHKRIRGRWAYACVLVFGVAPVDAQTNSNAIAVRADVVKPARRALTRNIRVPGTLEADEQVDLYAKASGYVSQIELDIGDRVEKGDLLAKISVPEMKDELRQAEAVLNAKQANARAVEAKAVQAQRLVDIARAQVRRSQAQHDLDALNLKRRRELHEGNAIPEQALDEARSAAAVSEAQLHIAEAQVAGAEAEQQAVAADVQVARAHVLVARSDVARLTTLMNYAEIRAPFDGVVTRRLVDHGTFVRSAVEGAASPLLRVAKTNRIRVVVDVPGSDAVLVRAGTEADIVVKALNIDPIVARVSRTAASVDPGTRTMRVEIDVENPDGVLIPGMYARVTLRLETKANAMMIPSKAIRVLDKRTVVFVAVSGSTQAMPIDIGYDNGIWAEILSGLSGQEDVIVSAGGALAPGTAVIPVAAGPS